LANTSLLLNVSCKSASIDKLEIAQKDGSYRLERPQLNVFVHAPFGQFKSTIFRQVADKYPAIILTDVTHPKLVGSYDVEQKTIVPSACWTHRNQTIILDEFYFKEGIINALLQLTESGTYSRAVARSLVKETNEMDGDLYFRATIDGEISIKTRFNAIIGTMHDVFRIPHVTYDALISRCVPVHYRLSNEDIKDIAEGKALFRKIELPNNTLGRIEWNDVEHFMALLDNVNIDSTLYARSLGDLCRIYNILGQHNKALYRFVIENKMRLPRVRERSRQRHGRL
jgi:hypothetical protein